MDWNRGYQVDGGYTYEYFQETNPAHLRFLASLKNHYLPADNFRYLELGCGQGFNLVCMAALNPDSEFVGVDFYPEHIAHARSLASKAKIGNVSFIEADFVDLSLNPDKLGLFHFVVAHGITTWISADTREKLFQLTSKVLEPGGLMYNSYNCLPGWLPVTPFQRLVIEYQNKNSGVESQKKAVATLNEIKKTKSPLFKVLPELSARLDALANKPIDYLLQEYNHPVWQPLYSSDMLRIASSFKLDFLSSANLPLAFSRSYTPAQNKIIDDHEDSMMRECVKDIACNSQFRRDIYVKGSNPMWPQEAKHSILSQKIIFRLSDISDIKQLKDSRYCFNLGNSNTGRLEKSKVDSILALCKDSPCQISDVIDSTGQSYSDVVYTISVLLSNGILAFASQSSNFDYCYSLNKLILESCKKGAPYAYLLYPGFSMACTVSFHSMIIASVFDQVEHDKDLLSSFISTAESIGLQSNGTTLAGKKLVQFAEKAVPNFSQKILPILLKASVFSRAEMY